MSLQRTAVNNAVTTALIFVAIAIFGIFSLMNLSINQLPDMETNFIMVLTNYPGASAEDIETNISKTLENTLNAVPDLKHLSSTSRENTSVISMEFESGIDIEEATNNVRDKLDMVRNYLPDGATNPVIFKFNAEDMPIMLLSVTAKESLPALEKIIDDRITTPLARVSGVGTVSANGAPKREIQVYVDPNKLEAYNLTIESISSTLMYENQNIPSGYIDIGSNTYNLRVEKQFRSAKEMEDIVVGSRNNAPVYLRDVARVIDGPEERSQESFSNGVQGATIVIQKQTDANAVNVIKGIKKQLKEIEKTLPSDVKVTIIVDGSTSIINSIGSLRNTIFITFLLVMLVVFVFLGRWRATFIIVLAIPISLLASLIYLFATGNTLNIISMSALSIAIGMVVDDAIVVLENITTHIERGSKPKEAAVHATQEVQLSVIASTLTMLADDVGRVPAADHDQRHGRRDVQAVGLDRFHHHDCFDLWCLDVGAYDVLEDACDESPSEQVPQGYLPSHQQSPRRHQQWLCPPHQLGRQPPQAGVLRYVRFVCHFVGTLVTQPEDRDDAQGRLGTSLHQHRIAGWYGPRGHWSLCQRTGRRLHGYA